VSFTVYHAAFDNRIQVLRLKGSHEIPELGLKPEMEYHVFLSHIWSSGQDQVAVIKRRTELLLPGSKCFLDIDDLQEIGDLAKYVAASQCVLVFLSKGYFFSPNCLKEVEAALVNNKSLILVHEGDVEKGGALLDSLRADCESKGRISVFDESGEVIPWHRVAVFQLLTLKMIAVRVLHCMPLYASNEQSPKVYIPGEIESETLEFLLPVNMYVSDFNPGAEGMATELVRRYEDRKVKLIQKPPTYLQPNHALRKRRSSEILSRAPGSKRFLTALGSPVRPFASHKDPDASHKDPDGLTHMLLYLNSETFVGVKGQRLLHEVQKARASGIEILLVHENDAACGGCPFERLFQTTPEELVSDGLYNKLAVACHPGPHRPVSLALVAKELGAVPKKSKFAALTSEASSRRSKPSLRRCFSGWLSSRASSGNFRSSTLTLASK